jgi:cytochrome c biogenesis protein CcmG/thiol:disulfide interchange protein DsbE
MDQDNKGIFQNRKKILLSSLVIVLFASFLTLLVVGIINRSAITAESGAQRLGQQAPEFTLENIESGEMVELSTLKGKPLVINFWASWCTPCRVEMPHFVDAFHQYSTEDITFIGIHTMEPESDARKFIDAFEIPTEEGFLILSDDTGTSTIDYGVSGIPATFFVDSSGFVKKRWIGGISRENLQLNIDALLNEET